MCSYIDILFVDVICVYILAANQLDVSWEIKYHFALTSSGLVLASGLSFCIGFKYPEETIALLKHLFNLKMPMLAWSNNTRINFLAADLT